MTTEALKKLEEDLWSAATKMRADSDLKLNEFATPVLGLIFLKFADNKYSLVEEEIEATLKEQANSRRQRPVHEIAIEKCGFYLPRIARYDYLLKLPEKEDIARAIKEAMAEIENFKPELKDTLPQDEYYELTRTDKNLPKTLLKIFADIPKDATGDVFGKIYEFFLGKFAMAEGQGGGEFFTPTSVVKYMVEVIEPYQGTIFDPACGSGGMFVQSSNFVDQRKAEEHNTDAKDLFVYGCEKTMDTVKLAKMNIAVNGLRGQIIQANSYYEDPHSAFGKFDYVMANPPFNVKDVNYDRVKDDKRFNTYSIPQNKTKAKKTKEGDANLVPNANYMWINLFATSLKPTGRAALVMANSASDARNSEKDIRETLIKKGLISQMVSLSSNMFGTVTLPASLWFFDKSNLIDDFETEKDKIRILFIDARNVYRQVDRAHREFTQEQVWNLAAITRLYHRQQERYIHLIHTYLKNINTTLPAIKESYQTFLSVFNEFTGAFTTWFQKTELNKEQKEWSNTEKLDELIAGLPLAEDGAFLNACETAERKLKEYLEIAAPTNDQQHQITASLTALEGEKRRIKKPLEKAWQQLERGYKLAEKELRDKNDKLWKAIPNLKEVRAAFDAYLEHTHEQMNREPQYTEATEGKSAIYFLHQVQWLQERFPKAEYEDITGLCKAASFSDIEEQDYSLNPSRYVGVVIEEDGMTEEEFFRELINLEKEWKTLSKAGEEIKSIIENNLKTFIEENE